MNALQPDTTLPKTKEIQLYTALITQEGTNAPTVDILHNTIGTITWTRLNVGQYQGIINNYTKGTTIAFITPNDTTKEIYIFTNREEQILITTSDGVDVEDGILFFTLIEIRVYNVN